MDRSSERCWEQCVQFSLGLSQLWGSNPINRRPDQPGGQERGR